MDKLMEFLMEQEVRENETVEVDIAGFPYPSRTPSSRPSTAWWGPRP